MQTVEYLSFGGGPPSVALLILNAWGEIAPKAELVIWADTGWEKAETYRLLPVYESWAAEMGMEWAGVQAKAGRLQDYLLNKSITIPAHTDTGMGHRQCTRMWKVAPIKQYLKDRFGKDVQITHQLAMTWGEAHRMRDAATTFETNRYPLIEKRLSRQDCIEIIKMAGLPVPPWSACMGCPLQNDARWRELASRFPNDFLQAAAMDEDIRTANAKRSRHDVYLHWSKKPLRKLYSTEQGAFPFDEAGEIIQECSDANCFT